MTPEIPDALPPLDPKKVKQIDGGREEKPVPKQEAVEDDAAKKGGYERVLHTTKLGGDGSQELIALMNSVRTPLKRVRVCGVNRSACVWNTVYGLVNFVPRDFKIEVACNATSDFAPNKWDPNSYSEKEYAKLAKEGKIKLLLPSSSG